MYTKKVSAYIQAIYVCYINLYGWSVEITFTPSLYNLYVHVHDSPFVCLLIRIANLLLSERHAKSMYYICVLGMG